MGFNLQAFAKLFPNQRYKLRTSIRSGRAWQSVSPKDVLHKDFDHSFDGSSLIAGSEGSVVPFFRQSADNRADSVITVRDWQPSDKSIEMSCQRYSGTANACRSRLYRSFGALLLGKYDSCKQSEQQSPSYPAYRIVV